MLSSGFCQGLPRGSSVPPGGLPEQDGNDDEDDDDAMHEECGFVMFCAFSVMYKKNKKTTQTKKQKHDFSSRRAFVSLSSRKVEVPCCACVKSSPRRPELSGDTRPRPAAQAATSNPLRRGCLVGSDQLQKKKLFFSYIFSFEHV